MRIHKGPTAGALTVWLCVAMTTLAAELPPAALSEVSTKATRTEDPPVKPAPAVRGIAFDGDGPARGGEAEACADCPDGATDENEPNCGLPTDFVNGGCNSTPPVFSPISCQETICGTAAQDATRDTDWYEIVLTETTDVTWTVEADFHLDMGIVDNGGIDECPAPFFLVSATVAPCQQVSVSATLWPGTWWFFVAPYLGGPSVPCGSGYVATLTCDGGGIPGCGEPDTGDCCEADGTPYCEDEACCSSVCSYDPHCCEVEWDDVCAADAASDPNCDCPAGGDCLYQQPPHQPADPWTFAVSDTAHPEQYNRYESFPDVGAICGINFRGADLYISGGWFECDEKPMPLKIVFYNDSGGMPDDDNPVCTYQVSITGAAEQVYTGFVLQKFYQIGLHPCCSGISTSTGWVSIQGQDQGENCWFLWLSSGGGDGSSCLEADGAISCGVIGESDFDLSMCLLSFVEDCPSGPVEWLDPPDGVVDAGQPHDVSSTTPPQGIDTILVGAPDGAVESCWELCETDDNNLGPNGIAGVVGDGMGTYTITLERPITPGSLTTIRYAGTDTGAFIAHPANVNGDPGSSPLDILDLIDFLNNALVLPWGSYSCDADRSGDCNSADILTVIDLLNGAGAFDPWNGSPLPVNDGSCP